MVTKYIHLVCTYIHTKELTEVGMTKRPRTDTLKYGLASPLHDYYHFNCSRQNSVRMHGFNITSYIEYIASCVSHFMQLQDWSYDRAQLIYMREIGEGQFGKVLLMKAKVFFTCSQLVIEILKRYFQKCLTIFKIVDFKNFLLYGSFKFAY